MTLFFYAGSKFGWINISHVSKRANIVKRWCWNTRISKFRLFQPYRWQLSICSITLSCVSVICEPSFQITQTSESGSQITETKTKLCRRYRGASGMVEINRICLSWSTSKKVSRVAYKFVHLTVTCTSCNVCIAMIAMILFIAIIAYFVFVVKCMGNEFINQLHQSKLQN